MAEAPIQRLPLVLMPENRDQTSMKDAKIINAFVEKKKQEGEYEVYKRPGLSVYQAVSAATGYGCYNWNGDIYAVFGGTLYKNGVSIGSVSTAGGKYYFSPNQNVIPQLFLHNGTNSYVWNGTTLSPIVAASANLSFTASVTAGSTAVTGTSINTSLLAANVAITGVGIPSSDYVASITTSNSFQLQVASTVTNANITLTASGYGFTGTTVSGSTTITAISINTSLLSVNGNITGNGIPLGSYIVSILSSSSVVINTAATASASGVVMTTTTAGFPPNVVHGVAWLDGTTYVMDTSARIWGSNINDVTAWDALNFITAQSEQDGGVAIARQLANVVAIKQWTSEVFYDAGSAVGSPLLPVGASKQPFGCVNADTVVSVSDRLFWLGTNRSGAKQVVEMENLVCKSISSQPIERLLDTANCTQAYGWTHKEMGHIFYGITLPLANLTIVYDLTIGIWYQWTDPNGNYFPVVDSTYTTGQGHLMQHISNGDLLTPSATNYNDLGSVFTVDLYTPKFDGGSRFNKMLTSIEVVGDTVSGSSIQIRFSDDDYQSWTNFRTVDLSRQKPMLWDCGTFRSRAFHLRHKANTPMRISSIDLQLLMGTL